MSQTTVVQNGNTLQVNTDRTKIFIGDNEYISGQTFKNNTGSTAEFAEGTLVGRESDTGDLVPLASGTGTNGENIPVGILVGGTGSLADAATETGKSICISGKVSESKLVLQGADTLETVIATRRLKDRILGDTKGIILVSSVNLTSYDN